MQKSDCSRSENFNATVLANSYLSQIVCQKFGNDCNNVTDADTCELPSREREDRTNADILQLTRTTCRAGKLSPDFWHRHC